jgi:hypothetical protein
LNKKIFALGILVVLLVSCFAVAGFGAEIDTETFEEDDTVYPERLLVLHCPLPVDYCTQMEARLTREIIIRWDSDHDGYEDEEYSTNHMWIKTAEDVGGVPFYYYLYWAAGIEFGDQLSETWIRWHFNTYYSSSNYLPEDLFDDWDYLWIAVHYKIEQHSTTTLYGYEYLPDYNPANTKWEGDEVDWV